MTNPTITRQDQVNLVALLEELGLDQHVPQVATLDVRQTGHWTSRCHNLLRERAASVPAGRYAIGEGEDLRFYQVDKPTEGRWAGYTFIKIQASDDLYPVRDRDRRDGILREIAKDPRAASIRYGHELGSCGVCGRTLTDPESIAAGIGPVCAGKSGW